MQFKVGDRVYPNRNWPFSEDYGTYGTVYQLEANSMWVQLDNGAMALTDGTSFELELRLPTWKKEVE